MKTSVGYYGVKIANPTCFHKRKENEMCESCLLKPKALAIYNQKICYTLSNVVHVSN